MQLDNVQVFAASVAIIMDQLYRSFPLSCSISTSTLEMLYGPSDTETKPRLIHPGEPDYEALLPESFLEDTAISYVCFEQYSEYVNARPGKTLAHWTQDQRRNLAALRNRERGAKEIFNATLSFLVRERYIVQTSQLKKQPPSCEYVLTSKGFAHLNKKFEGGTIRDEFQHKTSDRIFQLVKGGGDVATAGKALVDALSTFFM
jgi:hypothetical protein